MNARPSTEGPDMQGPGRSLPERGHNRRAGARLCPNRLLGGPEQGSGAGAGSCGTSGAWCVGHGGVADAAS